MSRQLEIMLEELVASNEEALKEAANNDEETRRQVVMVMSTMKMIFIMGRWRPWSSS